MPLFFETNKKIKDMKAKQCIESLEMWANSPLPTNEFDNPSVAAPIEGLKKARREVLALIEQYQLNAED